MTLNHSHVLHFYQACHCEIFYCYSFYTHKQT